MQRLALGSALRWVAGRALLAGIALGVRVMLRGSEQGVTAGIQPTKPAQPGSDWPMYRRDPALTAVSPLRGGLGEAPQVAWSLDLGGPKVPRGTGPSTQGSCPFLLELRSEMVAGAFLAPHGNQTAQLLIHGF